MTFAGCSLLEFKSVAGLQVVTNDVPSSVFINGQYLNKAPLIDRSLKPGVYEIEIRPDDSTLTPYETTINLRKGFVSMITWKPAALPELSGGVVLEMEELDDKQAAEVEFETIPDAAIIHVGERREFSPVTITDLSPGRHDFEISLPSYETQQHTLEVQPGYRLLVSVKLAKSQAIEPPDTSGVAAGEASNSATPAGSPTPTPPQTELGAEVLGTQTTKVTVVSTNFFQDGEEVLRVRSQPSAGGAELGFVPVGSTQQVLTEEGGWYKISFAGKEGWISAQFARKLE